MKTIFAAAAALTLATAPVYAQQVNTQRAPVIVNAGDAATGGVALGNTGLKGVAFVPLLIGGAAIVTTAAIIIANNDSSSDTVR